LDEHENNPVVTIRTKQLAEHLKLNVSDKVFAQHEAVSLSLRAICNGDTPELITNYQLSPFLVEDDETLTSNIGIHFNASQVDIQKLAETLRNDTKLDDILHAFDEINFSQYQPLASSYILPILKQGQYDRRTPPTLFTGQIVDVRVGIDVQSISNFELTTMDYDMDVWLRMAWRDPRLAHGFDRPIMINEETFLKKLWRPDPFFANAKKASFHRVTYLNFYMLIFPQGEIFFETRRLVLKHKVQLETWKPNGKHFQVVSEAKLSTCSLQISS
uniref:Neur_chan_LBD domain-containing protein n=1 Tax=Anisakis simplex TaxID=6269 RepID=A0A0M3J1H5_ANISI